MKVWRIIWRLLVGAGITAAGFYMAMSQMEETTLTGAAVLGIALVAVGASVLAGAFD